MGDVSRASNPSAEPVAYPGDLVRSDCLLVGSWVYPLTAAAGAAVADWVVDGTSVSTAVERWDAAPMAARVPVLAVGSNAAPGQLAHKYRDFPPLVLPLTVATVGGLGVGYSAHVSAVGYVPHAPLRLPGARRRLVVLWPDPDQVATLDRTEPNYRRTTFTDVPAVLTSGERLPAFGLYRSRWGLLAVPAAAPALAATTQQDVFAALAGLSWFAELVPEVAAGAAAAMKALVADDPRRLAVRAELAARGHAVPDGL